MDTCSKCGAEERYNNSSWGRNCLKKLNQKNYWRRRKNKKEWAKVLLNGRKRFKRLGHKKFKSICMACGKKWLGVAKVRRFCSQKCVSTGVNNGRWNGGKYISRAGYILVWNPKHHSRYEPEHRSIMRKIIGRELLDNEDVHHINGIKTDNRPENLQLLTKSEHTSLHMKERFDNSR